MQQKNLFIYGSQRALMPLIVLLMIVSCRNNDIEADAYGNFEADEIIVSAQSQGIILSFEPEEGDQLIKDQLIGMIDTTSVYIKLSQLNAQKKVVSARSKNMDAQIDVQEEQRINLKRELERTRQLLEDDAATQQQFDDLNGKMNVLDLQIKTLHSQQEIILSENTVLSAQMEEVRDMMNKCRIINPVKGTVLEKFAEAGELVAPGKALYKIADLSKMKLRVYISESQLSAVSLNDSVRVYIDAPGSNLSELTGTISWISSEAEFTPKIIQTREERVNMVYALEVRVDNDGRLKIGMPGEVVFSEQ